MGKRESGQPPPGDPLNVAIWRGDAAPARQASRNNPPQGGTAMPSDWLKRHANLKNLTFAFALVLFVWVVWYCYTGFGGPQELVSRLLPIALVLQILFMYQNEFLYKWLPAIANHVLVVVYIGICVYAFVYFYLYYEDIAIWRQGSYTTQDFVVGLLMFLLVMELSRLAHPTLFWVNFGLVLYTLFGYLSPLDFFWHPGTSFYRVVTSSTVEMSNGIYGIYGQIALTLIAAFLLLAAVANGFGAQSAMIRVMQRLAGNSRQMVPQAAVMGSLSIGMVSGSGSANAVVVGSITIPLMKRYGVPPVFAAAVETAASMGGLIMPPMMGVGAFLMSEFLGVPYWDVVIRGFALALTYYGSLAFAVYLICVRLLPREADRCAEGAGLPPDQDFDFLSRGRVSHGDDGLGRYGGVARGALYRGLHVRSPARQLPLFQVRAEGPGGRRGDVPAATCA